MGGTCPNRHFVLGSALVIVNAKTVYTAAAGSCETLVFSQRVDVTGVLVGQTLTATQIRQLKNKDKP